MPYRLRKAPNRNLYWVVGEDGTKHSKDPIPRERAEAQIRALYASENKNTKRGGTGTSLKFSKMAGMADEGNLTLQRAIDIHKEEMGYTTRRVNGRRVSQLKFDLLPEAEKQELIDGWTEGYNATHQNQRGRKSGMLYIKTSKPSVIDPARARINRGGNHHHQLELLKKKLEGAGLRGSGFFDTLWKVANKVKEYVIPAVKHIQNNAGAYAEAANAITSLATPGKLNPSSQRWLAENENYDVVGLTARRAPVSSWIEFFFSLLTEGKWDEAKKKVGYDKMFHLALGLTIRKPDGSTKESKLEKLSQPNFTDDVKPDRGLETMPIAVPQPIKVGELIRKTQLAMGDKFYSYNAFQNNCQNFVMAILDANGLATPEIRGFVFQPVDELLKEQPEWTENFSKSITNLGGITDRIFQGYGNLRGCKANHHNASSMKIGGAKFIRVMLPEKKKV
jgi:hypothetical protein